MDKITRYLVRERDHGYKQVFPFTTYSIIFNQDQWPQDENAQKLLRYLQTAFLMGMKGLKKSPSAMPELLLETRKIYKSEFCDYAKLSGAAGKGKMQHEIVENYFMTNHPDCIAIEAPVNDMEVEGCIDILLLQLQPFKVKILDYKPNAAKEKKAATQLYYYLKALVLQTNIDVKYFDLYYFDEHACFQVNKPAKII